MPAGRFESGYSAARDGVVTESKRDNKIKTLRLCIISSCLGYFIAYSVWFVTQLRCVCVSALVGGRFRRLSLVGQCSSMKFCKGGVVLGGVRGG